MSLRAITSAAEISKAFYCRIEAGEVGASDDVRIRIARAFGVRVEDIWAYPDTSEPETATAREAS